MNPCRAVGGCIAALLLAAFAHAVDGAAGERARIAAERAATETTLAQRERECSTRFVVTACVEEARGEYRAALASLRRQQALLDETERRQRAGERLGRLATKADAAGPPAPRARAARAVRPAVPADGAASMPAQPSRADDTRTQEAARAAAFAARTQAAQEHRAAVERRNAEREKKGKKARPLPVPASGVAP
jgi:hypothetical protein